MPDATADWGRTDSYGSIPHVTTFIFIFLACIAAHNHHDHQQKDHQYPHQLHHNTLSVGRSPLSQSYIDMEKMRQFSIDLRYYYTLRE